MAGPPGGMAALAEGSGVPAGLGGVCGHRTRRDGLRREARWKLLPRSNGGAQEGHGQQQRGLQSAHASAKGRGRQRRAAGWR